jgi:molybdopterin synthase sulfur carrier subunit
MATTVLLFAQAREAAGTRRADLEGENVVEVLAAADARFGPEFARLRTSCSVAVDGEVVAPDAWSRTAPGAELAVLPPVSGGCGGRR